MAGNRKRTLSLPQAYRLTALCEQPASQCSGERGREARSGWSTRLGEGGPEVSDCLGLAGPPPSLSRPLGGSGGFDGAGPSSSSASSRTWNAHISWGRGGFGASTGAGWGAGEGENWGHERAHAADRYFNTENTLAIGNGQWTISRVVFNTCDPFPPLLCKNREKRNMGPQKMKHT